MANSPGTGSHRVFVFVFFFVEALVVVAVEIVVVVGLEVGLFLVLVLARLLGRDGRLLLELHVDADVTELRVHQLEELVDVVARPLVEHVGDELEEVAAVEAALDLLDLLLGEGFEDVFTQRLGVPLFDGVLRRETNLPNRTLVENDLHRGFANTATARELSTDRVVRYREAVNEVLGLGVAPRGVVRVRRCARTSIRATFLASLAVLVGLTFASTPARADDPPDPSEASAPANLKRHFLQYGLAFTGEVVAYAGPMCSSAAPAACILGSGGGVAIRVGRRARAPWYFGAAYEFSKQDPGQLYRLAILQQLRAEARYYFETRTRFTPLLYGAAGVNTYGNIWGIDTIGPGVSLGGGVEAQVAPNTIIGLTIAYRALGFTGFTDSAGNSRSGGIAHVVGIDLSLETRDAL